MLKDIDVILSDGGGYTVEFKENPDKALVQEVCAFANASGGRVLIGVSDSGKIVGTDTGNVARSRIQDSINQIEPRLPVNMQVYDSIIVITVPQGNNKPYSCSRGFFVRFGPNSQKLERDEIVDFFQSEGHIRYDSIVREDLPIEEKFDEKSYVAYINKAKISEVLGKAAILKNLGCIEYINSKAVFTNAGGLFFRKNSEDIVYQHATVVCALYKGKDKVYILDAKEYSGGMVENIDEAMLFLKRHLKLRYEIEKVQRKNILEIPEKALREALINAVCHRNYFEKGARVMVEVFDNRVEIVSPGGLPKGITDANFGSVSVTRNPVIANLLHRIDYIERMGTGINRIRTAMQEAGLELPIFENGDFFKVIFKRVSSASGEADSEADDEAENKAEKMIIKALKSEPAITRKKLQDVAGLSSSKIYRTIVSLKNQNKLIRHGSDRAGFWEVNE
ncbi:MAG: helix-turn-helix domain-containing protein [Actinomycetia bacterium]|nr:helix-turn-helix domain-containing protein [Actinomycetes bacterium]